MSILKVERLCKNYEKFQLKDVSFNLEEAKITGFIGRNGAGKTTTLKSILNLIHPNSGKVWFFGKDYYQNELEIKQKIGFVLGGVNFYPQKKIKTITSVFSRFYSDWDNDEYRRCMALFNLDEEKKPATLSAGMKVKYSLTLALSHHARVLILDEPTSGLDPVSRDEILDIFLKLAEEGVTILFSTHITSDLQRCADNIIYIKKGRIIGNQDMETFISEYKIAHLTEKPDKELEKKLIGIKKQRKGFSALIKSSDLPLSNVEISDADLEKIMIHIEKE